MLHPLLPLFHACMCVCYILHTGVLRLPRPFKEEKCVHVRLQREGDSLAVQYQRYVQ